MHRRFFKIISICFSVMVVILTVNHTFAQETGTAIDSLVALLNNVDDKEKVDVLNDLAKEYSRISPDKTIAYSEEAILLAKDLDYTAGEATATKYLATAHMYLSSFDSAFHYLNRSLEKFTAIDDSKGIAAVLTNIASIHSIRREYALALENYSKALQLFEELENLQNTATLNRLIGIVYGNLYDHPRALSYFRKASELASNIGNEDILAYSQNNIAITYGELSDYENARLYYLKAIEVFEKTGNLRGVEMAKANLSTTYANLNDYDNAIKLLQECIDFSREINDVPGYAMSLSNIGMMYSKKEEYDKALEYIEQALQLHRELGFKAEISRDLLGMGVIYKETNYPDKAREYLLEAQGIAMETGDYWAIATCYENLSELNVFTGNLRNALKDYKLYKLYNDSIITEENREKLAELEVKYQTEKKDKENLMLQQEVMINEITIKQKNAQITVFIIVILIVLALLIVIFILFRQKSRSYAALVHQNLKALEIEKKLERNIAESSEPRSSEIAESENKFNELGRRLSKFLVEEKPYLWADISMEEFCRKLDTNRTYLSKVINDQYNQSFNDLLCEYRVRAARDLLADHSNKHLSMEGIGEMAGFNNNATFHRKFKSLVSLTPKQFREKALK